MSYHRASIVTVNIYHKEEMCEKTVVWNRQIYTQNCDVVLKVLSVRVTCTKDGKNLVYVEEKIVL